MAALQELSKSSVDIVKARFANVARHVEDKVPGTASNCLNFM